MARRRRLDEHPTVLRIRERSGGVVRPTEPLDAGWLRGLALESGADDVGFVEIERAELADERAAVDAALPGASPRWRSWPSP
ncbi:hypothetical protein [Nocardia thraciensis]